MFEILVLGFHGELFFSMVLMIVSNTLMQATMTTLAGLPAGDQRKP